MQVDVSEEMMDLLKVYRDAAEHLERQSTYRLDSLVSQMEDFVKVHKEAKQMKRKLEKLCGKMDVNKCNDCNHEDEDEEYNETIPFISG